MRIFQSGFGLTEVVVTAALLGVFATLAAPGVTGMIRENRMQRQAGALLYALAEARQSAVRAGRFAGVCRSADGQSCSGIASGDSGWIVYVDADGDGTFSGGDRPVTASAAVTGLSLKLSGAAAGGDLARFSPNGAAASAATLYFCDSRGAPDARGVVVFPSGAIRVTLDGDGDGIGEDHSGNPLSC